MNALTYSANAYTATVAMRSGRTILVEGSDDKKIINRLLIALLGDNSIGKSGIVIDTAEIIRDCPGVQSNREKVEFIHSLASDRAKLSGWVDREFRMFAIDQIINDQVSGHNVIHASLFWTRGHSIENYFFDPRIIFRYLEQNFPEHLPPNYRQSVQAVMEILIRSAASVSLAAKETELTTRMRAFFTSQHWTIRDLSELGIDESQLRSSLGQRGVDTKGVERFMERYRFYKSSCDSSDSNVCRWVVHGHLGSTVLWSGIGAVLEYCGLSDKSVVQGISQGDWERKLRIAADEWSQATVKGEGEPPSAFLDWLRMKNI